MSDYHEPYEHLSDECRNLVRALSSLCEEIEAVGWYEQRREVCTDPDLAAILEHNRNEEIEHACMALEWLRRRMPAWNEHLRTYLFTSDSITGIEADDDGGSSRSHVGAAGLGIGRPKGPKGAER